MKSFISLILVPLCLSACTGGYTQQVNNHLQTAAQKEMGAWRQVQNLYDVQCPHGTKEKPLPKEDSVISVECYEALARQYVIPVALYPMLVNELLTNYKQNAIDSKNGKIDTDQANLNTQRYWNDYIRNISAKGDHALMQAYQADTLAGQRRQQAAMSLSKDLLADGVIGGRGAPGAIETSCQPNILGGMDCVSH